jgi:DNA-binding protein HU-beta
MASGMTKTQLVSYMAEKVGTNNKTAATFLETLADTAVKETKKSGIFVIPGLGRLVKAHRKERMGRNPQTGEPIKIKAKTVVKFRVAKAAKDSIAKGLSQLHEKPMASSDAPLNALPKASTMKRARTTICSPTRKYWTPLVAAMPR